jgi:hypothetical protein
LSYHCIDIDIKGKYIDNTSRITKKNSKIIHTVVDLLIKKAFLAGQKVKS